MNNFRAKINFKARIPKIRIAAPDRLSAKGIRNEPLPLLFSRSVVRIHLKRCDLQRNVILPLVLFIIWRKTAKFPAESRLGHKNIAAFSSSMAFSPLGTWRLFYAAPLARSWSHSNAPLRRTSPAPPASDKGMRLSAKLLGGFRVTWSIVRWLFWPRFISFCFSAYVRLVAVRWPSHCLIETAALCSLPIQWKAQHISQNLSQALAREISLARPCKYHFVSSALLLGGSWAVCEDRWAVITMQRWKMGCVLDAKTCERRCNRNESHSKLRTGQVADS